MKIQLSEKEIILECITNLIARGEINEAWTVALSAMSTVIHFTKGDGKELIDEAAGRLKTALPKIETFYESHPNNRS